MQRLSLQINPNSTTVMTKLTGQTQDVGFQFGIRRTIPISLEKAWDFLFSDKGINIWLGELTMGDFSSHKEYRTKNGITGTVKVFKPHSHIRLTWKKNDWPNTATLQMRTIPAKTGTTISFHIEKLLDSHQREAMKKHWEVVQVQLMNALQ